MYRVCGTAQWRYRTTALPSLSSTWMGVNHTFSSVCLLQVSPTPILSSLGGISGGDFGHAHHCSGACKGLLDDNVPGANDGGGDEANDGGGDGGSVAKTKA